MEQRDLTVVGLTEDRSRLVLVSDAGEEFTLAADARLLAALRGDHARLGQLEITMESALRPRDIQARIRSGESPESVAAAAQTSLDKVMGYATPVLAERAHIADRAQRASVRRKAGEGPSRMLADAVAERLRSRQVDPSAVAWDAWRREDGRWTLVADYRSGESARHAEFVYDAPGRYVVAEDDEARWLVGEATSSHGPQPRQAGAAAGRRLSAVPSDDELPLGEDALELVKDAVPHPIGESSGDADWIATQVTDRPEAPAAEATTDDPADTAPVESTTGSAEQADEQPQVDEGASRKARRKPARASVPSWDEIMFGGGKGE